jgi:hypothetical protein
MEYNEYQSKPIREELQYYAHQMPANWLDELHNYIVFGFEPGRFHKCLYANDLVNAASASDSFNKWEWIQAFMMFLQLHAPAQCWGTYDRVNTWVAMNRTVRFKICRTHNLILTPQEATWDVLKNSQ